MSLPDSLRAAFGGEGLGDLCGVAGHMVPGSVRLVLGHSIPH